MWFRKLGIFVDKLQDQQWSQLVRFFVNPRFGTDTSYTEFEPDGTMVSVGDATTYDDVYPSSVTIGVGGNAPSFSVYAGNLKAYEFTGGTSNKEMHIGYQIYHSYEEGTSVVPHLHVYVANNGVGGTVIFDMEYEWANVDDTGTVTTTTVQATLTLPADSTVRKNQIISFGDITGTGKKISSVFMTKITRRQDLDTFSGSVWLKSADIHIRKSTIGSREPFTK